MARTVARDLEKEIDTAVKGALSIEKSPKPFGTMIMNQGVAFTLTDEPRAAYIRAIRLLQQQHFSKKFSEGYIRKKIDSLLATTMTEGNLKRNIDALIAELETYDTKQTVYIPITGIALSIPELAVGNVTFFVADEKRTAEVKASLADIASQIANPEPQKQEIIKLILNDFQTNFSNKVFSKYQVVAEPDRAFERATEETEQAINLLHYAALALHDFTVNIQTRLAQQKTDPRIWRLALSETTFNPQRTLTDHAVPLEVSKETLASMNQLGLDHLSQILANESPTDFEETLLRSVSWFAKSRSAPAIEDKFLSLIIALETLFTPKGAGVSISTSIAEALVLVSIKGLEARKKTKKKVQAFYAKRSAISHGGTKQVLEMEVLELTVMVFITVQVLLKKTGDIKTREELQAWIEDLKLSAGT